MLTIDLDGKWTACESKGRHTLQAQVPGCIHTDLLKAGLIEDPFYRQRELDVQWVGLADWTYRRQFTVTARHLACQRILLVCDGLDTLASIRINGAQVGRADNQFRTWEFDVKELLKSGTNDIEILFTSPHDYQVRRDRERNRLASGSATHEWPGRPYVRKSPCNYGWDWGPAMPTCGISRSLRIAAFDTARIGDMQVLQQHGRGKRVELEVILKTERTGRPALTARFSVKKGNRTVASAETVCKGSAARTRLAIPEPQLWWPNGMGKQPLYTVTVELIDREGNLLDKRARRIGLRTLQVERKKDRWGESFQFAVNGVPFFAKGANWIPVDAFPAGATRETYQPLLKSAVEANMNMLRVWGGGIYEDDSFYDLCDELGLCVWQDFMFACAGYPSWDPAFMANVRAEAQDNVKRLRHHASIALWCGNNELEQFIIQSGRMSMEEYIPLFDKLLPGIVKQLDPQRQYWPCSPHKPHGDRLDHMDPRWGDAHLWSVWHGRQPFEWYRTAMHRFVSEFGFQSFPEPTTVAGYTAPGDRNITAPVMEHHQRSGIGNVAIVQYMLAWFRLPRDFDQMLWASQLLQALAIEYAVEHWRRNMPRCMGALYWQLNDVWPVASWASIDYHGRWKALHYTAKRFFAPILLSAVENSEKGSVEVHVSNDTARALRPAVRCTLTNLRGGCLGQLDFSGAVGPRASKRLKLIDLSKALAEYGKDNLLVWLDLVIAGKVVSTRLVTFAKPKRMELEDPEFSWTVRKGPRGAFVVKLRACKPALFTWLALRGADAHCSDNSFHLPGGRTIEITVTPKETMTGVEFGKRLQVRSLRDTYTTL